MTGSFGQLQPGKRILLLYTLTAAVYGQYSSNACERRVQLYVEQKNFTYDDYWHGAIRGLHNYTGYNQTTLSTQGCRKACGDTPRYNDILTAFGILTTWILPAIALVSNLPFENGPEEEDETSIVSRHPRRLIPRTYFFEPLINWMGSPQTTMASTLNNIHLLNASTKAVVSKDSEVKLLYRDVYTVLCGINQYEHVDYRPTSYDDAEARLPLPDLQRRTDRALIVGLLCPLYNRERNLINLRYYLRDVLRRETSSKETPKNESIGTDTTQPKKAEQEGVDNITKASNVEDERPASSIEHADDTATDQFLSDTALDQTQVLITYLAHHLRMLRRRGMYPLIISMFWFIVAFAVGLYSCFRSLGDYTTAHSLGLGLLLSFLPTQVLLSVADRNPNGTERCKELIQRWLYNVDAIITCELDPDRAAKPNWWGYGETCDLVVGDYVGQGRFLGYCGMGHYLLRYFEQVHLGIGKIAPTNLRDQITRRPRSWWLAWIASQLIVSIALFTAFLIAFNTPTIGLGCRSFFYLIQWTLMSVSWVIQGIWHYPPDWVRCISLVVNTASAILLMLLMIFQAGGILNTCFCQSSLFGSRYFGSSGNWGGYVQFGNSEFYERAYDVQNYWYPASTIGLVSCIFCSICIVYSWYRIKPLWDENAAQGRRVEGNHGVPLDWTG